MGEGSLRFCVLGSSSKGNSTLVMDGRTSILIDAGLPIRYMIEHIEKMTDTIDGIFISHEHIDHVRSVFPLARRYACPIYISQSVHWYIDANRELDTVYIVDGDRYEIGSLSITPITLPHDAIEPFGFVVETDAERLGIATDLGHVDQELIDRFTNLDFLVIESNYDPTMLEKGRYPRPLKERIKDDNGHLSNEQCRDFLDRVIGIRTSIVILSHLSEENNDPLLAIETSLPSVTGRDLEILLRVSYPRMATPLLPYGDPIVNRSLSTGVQVSINTCED